MSGDVKSAISTLNMNKSFCDLQVAGAITKLLAALEDADYVTADEEHQVEGRHTV